MNIDRKFFFKKKERFRAPVVVVAKWSTNIGFRVMSKVMGKEGNPVRK